MPFRALFLLATVRSAYLQSVAILMLVTHVAATIETSFLIAGELFLSAFLL